MFMNSLKPIKNAKLGESLGDIKCVIEFSIKYCMHHRF